MYLGVKHDNYTPKTETCWQEHSFINIFRIHIKPNTAGITLTGDLLEGGGGGGEGVLCISLFAILGYPQFKLKLIDSQLFTLKSIATVELDVNFPYLRLPLCHGSTTVLPRQMSGKRLVKFNGKLLVAVVKKGEREPSVTTVRAVKF